MPDFFALVGWRLKVLGLEAVPSFAWDGKNAEDSGDRVFRKPVRVRVLSPRHQEGDTRGRF